MTVMAGLAILLIAFWLMPEERQERYYVIVETVERIATGATMILICVELCFLTD